MPCSAVSIRKKGKAVMSELVTTEFVLFLYAAYFGIEIAFAKRYPLFCRLYLLL